MSLCFGNKSENLQKEIDKVCKSVITDIENHTHQKCNLINEENDSSTETQYGEDTTNFGEITFTQNKLYKIMQKYDLYN